MKRYQKKDLFQTQYNPFEQPSIPQDAKVGIYGRQSTINQVKNNIGAGEMQIEDLVILAKRLGVHEDDIILYIENKREDGTVKHASGRLRIDQREGLSALVERIETDEIKAVIVFLEDRLFRDETQIEVNKFILICQEHNCLVITPHMTYDFKNHYHVKQFRWKCEQAADFLRDYVRDRLQLKREQFALKGLYDGRAVPVGFIVDRRETISGLPNPTYKKYIVYEPHAEVIRRIFRRYLELGGGLKKLYRELKKETFLFPSFESWVDPRDVSKLILQKVPGGYHISVTALTYTLANVAYIGWWTYKGEIIKDNHEAIVSEDVFWYAFNRLSNVTPYGEERERDRPHPRYYHNHQDEAPVLLKDILQTSNTEKSVYVGYRFNEWYYIISWRNPSVHSGADLYGILSQHVDEAFHAALLTHMETTEDFAAFKTLVSTIQKEQEKKKQKTALELAKIDRRMQATLTSLTTDTDIPTVTRSALNAIYAELAAQKEALLHPPQTQTQEQQVTSLLSYHELLEKLSQADALESVFEDMQLLSQATTKRITLDGLSPHFLLLTIEWRTPLWGTEKAILWRLNQRGQAWSDEEVAIIQDQYPTMPQEELLTLLPKRSWGSIGNKAYKLRVSRKAQFRETSHDILSMQDMAAMQEYGLTIDEITCANQTIWL